ncbi:MAG TPA: hypothetical protein VL463_35375 [Kofleriaceae bacterium]|jgi:hypothetical protein|nr:hypothetical protein [Kofleriaceae bacterium]
MTRLKNKILITTASLLLMSGVALAQDEGGTGDGSGEGDGSGSGSASGDATATTPAGDATVSASGDMGDAGWPMAIIDRPLTLKASMIGAQAQLGIAHVDLGMLGSSTSEGLNVGADYGVSDVLQIGASYGLTLNEFEAKGPVNAHLLYRLAHGKLKVAADAAFDYDLNSKNGGISLGAEVHYNLAPNVAVFTPGYQLNLGVIRDMGDGPITLAVPVGVALQANPNIYAWVSTQVASFSISNSANVYISDITPATIGAFYSASNKLDIGVAANFFDLQNASDLWAITVGARIFKM